MVNFQLFMCLIYLSVVGGRTAVISWLLPPAPGQATDCQVSDVGQGSRGVELEHHQKAFPKLWPPQNLQRCHIRTVGTNAENRAQLYFSPEHPSPECLKI